MLGLFLRKVYPEINPQPERQIIDRIRDAVLGRGGTVDTRTTVLIALSKETGLVNRVLTRRERRENKQRLKEIASGNLVGRATHDAVAAVHAAIMVAVLMPVIVAS